MMQPTRTKSAAAIALCLSLAASGCGSSDHGGQTRAKVAPGPVKTPVPQALEQGAKKPADPSAGKRVPFVRKPSQVPANARKKVAELDVRPDAQRLVGEQAPAPGDTGATDPGYEAFIKAVVPLIDNYWAKKTSEIVPTATYAPPAHLVSYDGDNAPGCFGKRSADMNGNAYYCPSLGATCPTVSPNRGFCSGDDVIAWDRANLMLPFYQQIGKLASALVLAHEWGHLVQARIYPTYLYRTVERHELQADCFAGAWALEMKRQGRVDIGSFNETLDLFEKVGGEGAAWLDPDSHGNKYQRIRSFTQGFEEDAEGCVGKKYDALLSRIGLD